MGTVAIAGLSTEERSQLLEELWESLCATPEAVPLTDAQRDELDREGPAGIPSNELFRRIRGSARSLPG